jgi:transcriptional regulator with XRE-family HTH domain
MIPIEVTILEELTLIINRRGSKGDFAAEVGISQAYLSQILAGRRPLWRLPLSTAKKLSAASGISIDRMATATSESETA